MTEVSVIIPAYNSAPYIEEAVRTALNQTISDIEIIIIDDGSTDDTKEIAFAIAAEDRRVQVLSKSHEGVELARNLGVAKAGSEWVAFLDSDDRWIGSKLERQLEFLKANPRVAAVSSFGRYFSGLGRYLGVIEIGPVSQVGYQKLREEHKPVWLLTPSVVCRRSAIVEVGGFDATFDGSAEDLDLWTRLAEQFEVRTMSEHLVEVRVSANSASMTKFIAIQQNTLRVRLNTKRRSVGAQALTAEKFLDWLGAVDSKTQKKWARRWRGGYHYRQAGHRYLERRLLKCSVHLLYSIFLSPGLFVNKVKAQVWRDLLYRCWFPRPRGT